MKVGICLLPIARQNFAEFGVYLTLIVLGPLMEELVCRGLLQHAFFKNSRWGLDILFPSFLFALPHFSSFPSLLDLLVYTAVGCIFGGLTRYTKTIYPSYTIHIINNIIANLPLSWLFCIGYLHDENQLKSLNYQIKHRFFPYNFLLKKLNEQG